MKHFILGAILALSSQMAFAQKKYEITCQYSDKQASKAVKFNLRGSYSIEKDESQATLSYASSIYFTPDSDWGLDEAPENNFVFARQVELKSAKYNGRFYKDHFKFDLEWHGVHNHIEWGNLIISKRPIKTSKDPYGAIVEVFTGALDVSYNDHHGDYVKVECINRYFSER